MHILQLPLFEIALIVLFFALPVVYRALWWKHSPRMVRVALWLLGGLGFTALSLVLYGTRGGLPPAMIYGWPKEVLLVRDGVASFNTFYFFVDIVFYSVISAYVLDVRDVFKHGIKGRATMPRVYEWAFLAVSITFLVLGAWIVGGLWAQAIELL